jgi:GntR family transcriptional repressor for pyruvate dehydrogenase complex
MNAILPPAAAKGSSLVRQAMQAVTGHIRSQNLRVGDTLPGEGHFAAEMGVSRAVMREAFGALAALNLIEVANGRKPRVAAIDGSVIAASLDHAVSTAQVSVAQVWDRGPGSAEPDRRRSRGAAGSGRRHGAGGGRSG